MVICKFWSPVIGTRLLDDLIFATRLWGLGVCCSWNAGGIWYPYLYHSYYMCIYTPILSFVHSISYIYIYLFINMHVWFIFDSSSNHNDVHISKLWFLCKCEHARPCWRLWAISLPGSRSSFLDFCWPRWAPDAPGSGRMIGWNWDVMATWK